MKTILFICKYNRFRSRLAEIFFKKYNKNKNYKAMSAGLIKGRYPLDENEVSAAKELGIKLAGKPRGISTELLIKTDIIIITADDVPSNIFDAEKYGKELIIWKIPDTKSNEREEIINIIKTIENKVKELVERLR